MWAGCETEGAWLKGTILNVNLNLGKTTYDIRYDGEEVEEDKHPLFVQDLKSRNTNNPFDMNEEPSEEEEEEYKEGEEEEDNDVMEENEDKEGEEEEFTKGNAKGEDWFMSPHSIDALASGKVGEEELKHEISLRGLVPKGKKEELRKILRDCMTNEMPLAAR